MGNYRLMFFNENIIGKNTKPATFFSRYSSNNMLGILSEADLWRHLNIGLRNGLFISPLLYFV